MSRQGASVDHVGDSGVSKSLSPPTAVTQGTTASAAAPATDAEPKTPSYRGGGLTSSILGSGVFKKAYAAAANVTAAAATATAAATAKAVNSDMAANAVAVAASFGAGGGGVRWAGSGGSRSGSFSSTGGHDAGRHRGQASSRGGGGEQVEEIGRSEVNGGDGEQGLEEEEGEKPPFLSISVGDVSCFLPDVRWSVQMQQKRFLKVGDSGSVK